MNSRVIDSKQCRDCLEDKSLDKFIRNKMSRNGVDTLCKACNRKRVKSWRKANPEKRRIQIKRETTKQVASGYSKAKTNAYKAAKLKRTPKWADLEAIKEFYMNCPEGHEVDHIVPLRGEKVSGLHTLDNLQYLPRRLNRQKHNHFPWRCK